MYKFLLLLLWVVLLSKSDGNLVPDPNPTLSTDSDDELNFEDWSKLEIPYSDDSDDVYDDEMQLVRKRSNPVPPMRRSSLDKNFMRFGRSGGGLLPDERCFKQKDLLRNSENGEGSITVSARSAVDNFMRFGRDATSGFIRFGRPDKSDNFMRFGRGDKDNFMRFGRAGKDNFMRFGRGDKDNFMRFGRREKDNFMRFGRREKDNFMRFGKREKDNIIRFDGEDKVSCPPTYLSDFENVEERPVRITRNDNFMRFGRDTKKHQNFIRFGKSNGKNENFIRFGKSGNGNATNFLQFGRDHADEESDNEAINTFDSDIGAEDVAKNDVPSRKKRTTAESDEHYVSESKISRDFRTRIARDVEVAQEIPATDRNRLDHGKRSTRFYGNLKKPSLLKFISVINGNHPKGRPSASESTNGKYSSLLPESRDSILRPEYEAKRRESSFIRFGRSSP